MWCVTVKRRPGIVPIENSVRSTGGVIPPTGPQASSSLRLCLSRVNEIRRCPLPQGSTVRTQIPMAQGEKRVSVVDSSSFRQPVVRSGDAVHRPEAQPRRSLFPVAESLVAPERRTFQVQNKRKSARCQATTVSGLTMATAERQSHQRWDRQIHNRRSPEVNFGRFLADR
jgi:hypothetical protein